MPAASSEIIIILALILLNGLLSMSEMAIVSARKVRLQQQAEAGNASARTALDLAASPNRFLSTVQIGITLVGVLTGAFGGASLAEGLQMEGWTVATSASGEEAVGFLAKESCDLVVLDWMLPDRDGLQVLRHLRERGRQTPVLMLTARGRTPDKVAGLKIGADDYVTKPFKMPELLARIEALLRRAPTRPAPPSAAYEFGNTRVDVRGTEVVRGGKPATPAYLPGSSETTAMRAAPSAATCAAI